MQYLLYDKNTSITGKGNGMSTEHQVWATVSGASKVEIARDVLDLTRAGVAAIEFRVDLIPVELWDDVFSELAPSIPWWVAHFGTGSDADQARDAIFRTIESEADGAIFHSRCEHLRELVAACREAGKAFAAPYHSQQPLTLEGAVDEYAHQRSLAPAFRKIAVRANDFSEAMALVEATRRAAGEDAAPPVGAVFGNQRWARVALPHSGSAITFIVARRLPNEVGGDDEQLTLGELRSLAKVRGMLAGPTLLTEEGDGRQEAAAE